MMKIRVEIIGPHNHTWNLTFEISSFKLMYIRFSGLTIHNKI